MLWALIYVTKLGINEISEARPTQAALASGAAFIVGGLMPILVVLLFPFAGLAYWLYGLTTFFLMVLGILAAKQGDQRFGNPCSELPFGEASPWVYRRESDIFLE
jgi:VIT1/CCC1 family predicted Fe2+/Mn2+ transporter